MVFDNLKLLFRKFNNEVKAILTSLHGDLAGLSNSLESLKDSIDAQRNPNSEQEPIEHRIAVTDFQSKVAISVKTEAKRSKAERIWRPIKGTLEVAVGLAVILYTVISYQNWQEQIDATNLASRQAEFSRKGANETIKNFRLDERPYVTAIDFFFDTEPLVANQEMGLSIIADNSGRTPALKVKFIGTAYMGNVMIDKSATLKAESVIPSQHPTQAHYILQFNSSDLIKITSDSIFLIKGTIEYSDIFKVWHTTSYCAVYDGKRKKFTLCKSGNDLIS